ncbi:alpha/beta-hydrolase [Cucurbitaria berberidis CBS 394.84]|uniref:Alpha/beta-hydrolase n=1 Tax=Cucurbitaria berberidis CBS 394.84 TaxID=1168544 RepID=A0A9P4LB08_9PLEO|nr:alpha/beta-hydrolase [Cucurbitaria berberidis CBS 394.84]KAF1848033.1 alpha/beta-hydrolase [Cucurbitaria berberidis CBS 394.84]
MRYLLESSLSRLLLLCVFSASTISHGVASQSSGYTNGDGAAPTATIDIGVVIGKTTTLPTATGSVNQFLGIPFAQSPPERFSPPQSPPRAAAPINATTWKPACIQEFRYPLASANMVKHIFDNPSPLESEDCMYLNVYAPSTPAGGAGRPVLFWLFGGSFQFGSAGKWIYLSLPIVS